MSHSNELNWFNFETRMRGVVLDLLQPSMQKQVETAQEVTQLATAQQHALKRIEFIEDLVMEGKQRSEFGQGLFAEIAEVRGKLAVIDMKWKEERKEWERGIETLAQKQQSVETANEQNRKFMQNLEGNLSQLRLILDSHKEIIRAEMQQLQIDTFQKTSKIEDLIRDLKDTVTSQGAEIESVSSSFFPLENSISAISSANTLLAKELNSLSQITANSSELVKIKENLSTESQNWKIAIAELARFQKDMETFMDLYLPLEVQNIVSDSLFSIQEPRLLSDYVLHEKEQLTRFREKLASCGKNNGLDAMRENITIHANKVDTRRSEFELNLAPESPKGASKPVLKSASTVETTLTLAQSGYFRPAEQQASVAFLSTESIAKINVLEEEVKILQSNQNTKFAKELETLETYVKTLHDEFDSFTLNTQQTKATHKSDSHNLNVRVGQIEEDHVILRKETKALGALVAEVVEFCLIVHALLDQDEEDRKSIQLTGYREQVQDTPRARPKPAVLALDPKCLSCCGGNSGVLTAFKVACLTYNPSSLRYRGTIYSRAQMIHTLGDVLKSAWGRAVQSPPFQHRSVDPATGPLPTPRRKLISIKPEGKPLSLLLTPHRRLSSADFTG